MRNPTFIDLFAGAGGLSEGFIENGFVPVAHVEMDRNSCDTLKTRAAYHYLKSVGKNKTYREYLERKISREDLMRKIPEDLLSTVINEEISDVTTPRIFRTIRSNMASMKIRKIDVIIGGPPCQAYSLVGRARDPNGKSDDHRNYLYLQYAKFLAEFKPKFFVFENVPGMLSAKKGEIYRNFEAEMGRVGYFVDHRIVDSSDFGVLQKRRRVIVFGWRKDVEAEYPMPAPVTVSATVSEIFADLPRIQPGGGFEVGSYVSGPTMYQTAFARRSRDDVLTQHVTRPHNRNDREIYRIAIKKWRRHGKRLKYTDLPARNRTHRNVESFLDRFKVVADDLPHSHTMVAHISKDGHYYIHPDMSQLRSISVREAARIQSFPDNYYFEGGRTSAFRQIGNAVPPLLSKAIASEVISLIERCQ